MRIVRSVEPDARVAQERALGALTALVEDLAAGRTPVADPHLAEEVRRRDAELWARLDARGGGS